MHANTQSRNQEDVRTQRAPMGAVKALSIPADCRFRCFLFLVNYARMKPDVALKALPILIVVSLPLGAGALDGPPLTMV